MVGLNQAVFLRRIQPGNGKIIAMMYKNTPVAPTFESNERCLQVYWLSILIFFAYARLSKINSAQPAGFPRLCHLRYLKPPGCQVFVLAVLCLSLPLHNN
jgi:hypothetical protein